MKEHYGSIRDGCCAEEVEVWTCYAKSIAAINKELMQETRLPAHCKGPHS